VEAILLLAFRNLAARKLRALLTTLAMAYSIAMFVALSTLTYGVKVSVSEYVGRVYPADLMIYSDQLVIPVEIVDSLRESNLVEAVEPIILLGATVQGKGVTVVGIPMEDVEYFRVGLVEGRLPQRSDEAIVEESIAREFGVKPGDIVEVKVAESLTGGLVSIRVKVVGTFRSLLSGFLQAFQLRLIVLSVDALQKRLGAEGFVNAVLITLRDKRALSAVEGQVRGLFPDAQIFKQETVVETAIRVVDLVNSFFTAIVLTSLAISALAVLNTVLMNVRERYWEFAVLKAVGTSGGQIALSLAVEVLIISLFGGAVGIGLGYYGSALLKGLLWQLGVKLDIPITPLPHIFALAIALASAVGLLASAIPILRASRLRPAEVMRR